LGVKVLLKSILTALKFLYRCYKYNDDVKGEMYNYLDIVPEVTTGIINKVAFFNTAKVNL
jgi:hypothetical protein